MSAQPISYTVPGAAAATGLSEDSIRRAIRSKDLPAHTPVGGKYVILASDLLEWVKRPRRAS